MDGRSIFGAFVALSLLSTLCVVITSVFHFKQKVHSFRKEIFAIDSNIFQEQKRSMALEADNTLQHSASNIKVIADRYLMSARFTTVNQVANLDSYVHISKTNKSPAMSAN